MEKICLLIVSFSLVIASFAQTTLSVRTGVNVATTKNFGFTKNRAGWYGGLNIHIPGNKKLSFQPELFYSSKGNMINRQLDIGGYKSFRFNYMNMPVLLNYRFDKRTSIVIGPEFGYLLRVVGVLVGGTTIDATKRYPTKFDVAASVGIHYNLIKNISSEIRYNYGFNTIYYVDILGNRYSDIKAANRVFQIGMKYLFLKQKN